MKKNTIIAIMLLLSSGTFFSIRAQTAEALEEEGLAHFRKAFYEAMPQEDIAGAEAEFVLAEKAFRAAIRMNPGRVEPYLYLGRTFFVQEKYSEAAGIYRQATGIAPAKKEVYLQLASALEMAGDYESAVACLKTLRQQEKDSRTILILDDFIRRLELHAREAGRKKGGKGHE